MVATLTEPKVYRIGNLEIGGDRGERPTLLLPSMFHAKDKILSSRRQGVFDREKAAAYLARMEELSQATGVLAMVAMVSNWEDEFRRYVEFYREHTQLPFACDVWMVKRRLACAKVVADLGLQDVFLYNSITPWDAKDVPLADQVKELRDLGIRHVMLQAFDEADTTPAGRLKSLDVLLEEVNKANFASILVDSSCMSLPSLPYSLAANHMIKEGYGFPCGQATSNGSYMWRKELAERFGPEAFPAVDAAVESLSVFWDSDFVFCGPVVGIGRVMMAAVVGDVMAAVRRYQEKGVLPAPGHPLERMFPDFYRQLVQPAV